MTPENTKNEEKIYLLYNTKEAKEGLATTARVPRNGAEVEVTYTNLMRFKDDAEAKIWKKDNPENTVAWAGAEKDCKFSGEAAVKQKKEFGHLDAPVEIPMMTLGEEISSRFSWLPGGEAVARAIATAISFPFEKAAAGKKPENNDDEIKLKMGGNEGSYLETIGLLVSPLTFTAKALFTGIKSIVGAQHNNKSMKQAQEDTNFFETDMMVEDDTTAPVSKKSALSEMKLLGSFNAVALRTASAAPVARFENSKPQKVTFDSLMN